MKIKELTAYLETLAPLSYQEDYDNSGLIIGSPEAEINSALISLDCTEAVVAEAIRKNCDIIISHHPIIFKGIKKLNGKTYVERVVIKAIQHNIAIYAIHTNLDHVLKGVNSKICDKLGVKDYNILAPRASLLRKLVTFCPNSHADTVRDALFIAGAGDIGKYSDCSFNIAGTGTFKPGDGTNAFVGETGRRHSEEETRIEVIFSAPLEGQLIFALHEVHPYEEVAYDVYQLNNSHPQVGAGMIGCLDEALDERDFLKLLKDKLSCKVVRYTALRGKKIKRVAVCGGTGGFLLPQAISAGADVFVTADYKYHEFFDADEKIVIADVGHYESEQFTVELLHETITEKFPNFALHLTELNTNPINYLI
jgi:dinuclear metal center YbgI/SA1388 family protein